MNKSSVVVSLILAFIIGVLGVVTVKQLNKETPIAATAATVDTSEVIQAALAGFWKSTGDEKMGATITQSTIEILWEGTDFSGLYWKGSFLAPSRLVNGTKIVSNGDTDAMSESMLASQDGTKEFIFEKNALSFKLTMMGVTKTVKLVRA